MLDDTKNGNVGEKALLLSHHMTYHMQNLPDRSF